MFEVGETVTVRPDIKGINFGPLFVSPMREYAGKDLVVENAFHDDTDNYHTYFADGWWWYEECFVPKNDIKIDEDELMNMFEGD